MIEILKREVVKATCSWRAVWAKVLLTVKWSRVERRLMYGEVMAKLELHSARKLVTRPKTFVLSAELATPGDSRVIRVVTFCIARNASHEIRCKNIFQSVRKILCGQNIFGRKTSTSHHTADECWLIIFDVYAH